MNSNSLFTNLDLDLELSPVGCNKVINHKQFILLL